MLRIAGTTDDVTSCDCCGRQDLKSTVALDNGTGVVYFGVVCAAKALALDAKVVKATAREMDNAREAARLAEINARRDAEFALWDTWLRAHGAGADMVTRIQSLGGYLAAKAAYKEEHSAR